MEINGSVALVTGGSNGIGSAVAKFLAKRGAKVAVVGRLQENIDLVVKDIKDMGCEVVGILGNVTSEADTARFIQATLKAFGKLNIVVASAGIIRDGTMLSLDKDTGKVSRKMGLNKWQPVIDVNLTGTFLTLRDAAEAMVNGGWEGLLVPISSINKVGQVGQINYSSTKTAVALMPKIIIGEFLMRGIRNIRCVGIAPGYTATRMLTGMNQDALKALIEDVHIGRLVEPDEIAALICHCVENVALNATTIEITGGLCYPNGIAK
ncbi:SDR family NAD(P)-dependent oxidoreductase [Candidatus Methylospira mobilis]|uniref:SDR family NAD(P)-dependent oxidoreductase n=1 Tax=Candidatus Methylospira mobilis TaxID=1808979 RepID=A0A5Q0BMA7_9GAMM|nr:SDR family NAD(P)-dependent oxidoreductase [Candidatus Methylospira mobilis]QFY43248.1 SDR family NAD(P)-dependent oxidoreductase [Candidatus Methylospira mobilis]WNV03550.1 SDR family NAD(P)-dependent oxidoreductase [Candidatus Methylospira mobilis]